MEHEGWEIFAVVIFHFSFPLLIADDKRILTPLSDLRTALMDLRLQTQGQRAQRWREGERGREGGWEREMDGGTKSRVMEKEGGRE